MPDERTQILEMLAQGKITVTDAERLLEAIGSPTGAAGSTAAPTPSVTTKVTPKFLRVSVEGGEEKEHVNIRVPFQLLKAGVKLASLIPAAASEKINVAMKEKGINFDIKNLNPETLEELVASIGDLSLDVKEGGGKVVRIFCE